MSGLKNERERSQKKESKEKSFAGDDDDDAFQQKCIALWTEYKTRL